MLGRSFARSMVTAALALLPALACAQAQYSQVQVVDSGLTRTEPTAEKGFEGTEYVRQSFTLSNGLIRYMVDYHAYWDPKSEVTKQSPEGYIGMPLPTSCNWYHGGFMAISFNGQSLGNLRPTSIRAVEHGNRGLVEFFWKTTEGQLRIRFLQEPATDYLAAEIAVQPAKELRNLDVYLRCFPSFFTSAYKRDGWRQVIGPATTIEQGQTQKLDPAKDPWLLYQDRVFDVAKEKDSNGPCAALWLPEQIKSLQVAPASYPVPTSISAKPEVRSLRFAFWEFPKKTNADALKLLQQTAPQVSDRLRKLDFGDSQVAAMDPAKERATLDAMIAKTADPEKWQKQLVPLLEQATTAREALKNNDLSAEQTASEALTKYREAVWDLKFDALLSD
jgi:hypothetical protein